MKNTLLCNSIAVVIFFFTLPLAVSAQDPGDDPDVPFDGGLGILIAAGVGYGVKKAVNYKKQQKGGA